jgi:hypothetical protein
MPEDNERSAIRNLQCPLCGKTIGWDTDSHEGHPTMLVLYCKNDESCGIEVRKLLKDGWLKIIDHWKGLK